MRRPTESKRTKDRTKRDTSIQRTQSTLASHSAIPRGGILHNERQSRITRIAALRRQGVYEDTNLCFLEAQENPPEIPKYKETRVYANFFEEFARTFAFLPVTRVRNPTENCSEQLVQMNCFTLVYFFSVDFPPVRNFWGKA